MVNHMQTEVIIDKAKVDQVVDHVQAEVKIDKTKVDQVGDHMQTEAKIDKKHFPVNRTMPQFLC